MSRLSRRGFTLIELLIVIGIIALLLAIVLPAFSRAREQVRQIQCASNERQILMAMFAYADSNRGWLPLPRPFMGATVGNGPVGNDAIIWMPAQSQYDWSNGSLWTYTGARDVLSREKLFNCPADPSPKIGGDFHTDMGPQSISPRNFSYNFNYELFQAHGRELRAPTGVKLSRVQHTEHKILVVEEQFPRFEYCDFYHYMVTLPNIANPLTTRHWSYANIGMADGHVELFGPNNLPPAMSAAAVPAPTATTPKFEYYCSLPH